MTLEREAIYAALFELLRRVQAPQGDAMVMAPLKTYSRRLKHWSDVPTEDQPALYLCQGNEGHVTKLPGTRDFVPIKPKIYVYVRTTGDLTPGTVLNPILDQIQGAFPRSAATTGKCTLDGLVQHVIISGELLTFEGTLGDQEVAIIPLEVLTIAPTADLPEPPPPPPSASSYIIVSGLTTPPVAGNHLVFSQGSAVIVSYDAGTGVTVVNEVTGTLEAGPATCTETAEVGALQMSTQALFSNVVGAGFNPNEVVSDGAGNDAQLAYFDSGTGIAVLTPYGSGFTFTPTTTLTGADTATTAVVASVGLVVLGAPQGLFVTLTSASSADLAWTSQSFGQEDGFVIYRSLNGGAYAELDRVGPGVQAYSDTGMAPSSVYDYKVGFYQGAFISTLNGPARQHTPIAFTWNVVGALSINNTQDAITAGAYAFGKFFVLQTNQGGGSEIVSIYGSANSGVSWSLAKATTLSGTQGGAYREFVQASGYLMTAVSKDTILKTSDGITWTEISVPGSTSQDSMAENGNGYALVTRGARAIARATTPFTSWANVTATPVNVVIDTARGGNGIFALSTLNTSNNVSAFYVSTDNGATWAAHTVSGPIVKFWHVNGFFYYARGDGSGYWNGEIYKSADAVTWTLLSTTVLSGGLMVTYQSPSSVSATADCIFFTVVYDNSVSINYAMTSDGVLHPLGSNLWNAQDGGGQAIVIEGPGPLYLATDRGTSNSNPFVALVETTSTLGF